MTGQLRLAPTLGGKEEVDCEGSGSFTPGVIPAIIVAGTMPRNSVRLWLPSKVARNDGF